MSTKKNFTPVHTDTLTSYEPDSYGADMWPGDTFTNRYGETWVMGRDGRLQYVAGFAASGTKVA